VAGVLVTALIVGIFLVVLASTDALNTWRLQVKTDFLEAQADSKEAQADLTQAEADLQRAKNEGKIMEAAAFNVRLAPVLIVLLVVGIIAVSGGALYLAYRGQGRPAHRSPYLVADPEPRRLPSTSTQMQVVSDSRTDNGRVVVLVPRGRS
jgi:hypothetical protein